MYGSYRKPRELSWIFGVLIYLALMAEAFFGYLLPWGQMSYWGAQVIVNLFATVPIIGEDLALWIRGDYMVSDMTLNRFFAFHVIAVPLVLLGLVAAHLMALHEVGSNNPDGVEIKKQPKDPATGHAARRHLRSIPYYTVKDIVGVIVFLVVFCVDHVLRAGDGRLLPRVQQLHPGRSAEDARAHRAGVVLHAVLRDAARGAVVLRLAVLGRAGDGRRDADPVLPALARPQPGEVDPLPRPALQGLARRVRHVVPDPGLLGVEPITVWGQFADSDADPRRRRPSRPVRRAICTVVYFLFFLLMPWYTRARQGRSRSRSG